MDKFVEMGKEFLEQRSGSGSNSGYQENSQLPPGNSQSHPLTPPFATEPPLSEETIIPILTREHFANHVEAYGGNYPAGGDFHNEDEELRSAHQHAQQYAGSSGSSDIFSSVISSIGQKKGRLAEDDIDEQDAINKHKQTYEQDADNLDSGSLGSAAALQALKKFTQGETGGNQSQGAFLGLAMSEASKLFDSKAANGKVSSEASKESAIQQAGELALKMYMKSQGGGQQGPSGLLGIASKFF